jgi:hypothetical protein
MASAMKAGDSETTLAPVTGELNLGESAPSFAKFNTITPIILSG